MFIASPRINAINSSCGVLDSLKGVMKSSGIRFNSRFSRLTVSIVSGSTPVWERPYTAVAVIAANAVMAKLNRKYRATIRWLSPPRSEISPELITVVRVMRKITGPDSTFRVRIHAS